MKNIHFLKIFLILVAVGHPFTLRGGLPFTTYYNSQRCDFQPQSWEIIQDSRGIIYAANLGGLLEFDGVTWRTTPIPNHTVRSIAIADDKTLFVGGRDEIGFFSTGPFGALHYNTLNDDLPPSLRNFGTVWGTHATQQGIYFWTTKHLFRLDRKTGRIKVWNSRGVFSASFVYADEYYIRDNAIGFMKIVGDSLRSAEGGKIFAAKKSFAQVPFSGNSLLTITRDGMYLYDGETASPYPTTVDHLLKNLEVNCGTRLRNGDIALGTRLGGVLILTPDGGLEEVFDKSAGLPDNMIRNVFEDRQGALWLAMDKGIVKIEYASPFRTFNDQNYNLPGIVLSVVRHGSDDTIFAGTTTGLYIQKPDGTFRSEPRISGIVWSLLPTDDSLLAGTNRGIIQLAGGSEKPVSNFPTYVLIRSGSDANRIWAGTQWGLISLRKHSTSGLYREEYKFDKIQSNIHSIVEDNDGSLWIGTLTQGVVYVTCSRPLSPHGIAVTQYNQTHGLPPGEIHVFPVTGRTVFATAQGIFEFNRRRQSFVPFSTLGDRFAGGPNGVSVFRLAEAADKQIWIHSLKKNFRAIPQKNGPYRLEEKVFLRLPFDQVNAIFPDPGHGKTWFAAVNGLISFDTTREKNTDTPFDVIIRNISINGKPHSPSTVPSLEYNDRNLLFQFAAPFFESESKTEYRCLLEGYDKDWSPWEKKTEKNYTNLNPRRYSFKVQAKNIYGTISREDSFNFKILSPWYLTWWALLSYMLTGLSTIYLAAMWRSRHLVKEKRQLEQIIGQRTKEIQQKNIQLEEMDRIKSRFFANISHEFRTPLTLIMAPLERMIYEPHLEPYIGDLRMMDQNSRRLLNLINQLLQLSQFDNGTMKLKASCQNIVPFLKGILHAFDTLAAQRQQRLSFVCEEAVVDVYFDSEKMEEVVNNLLSNAIKFTPPGGAISVSILAQPDHIDMTVRDTGPGIPREEVSLIFDRFYQTNSTYEHHRQGSGIGLAIAKEIVELHHGEILARNRDGIPGGAEIVVRLLLGKDHLSPEETIPHSEATWKLQEKTTLDLTEPLHENEDVPGSSTDILDKDIVLVVDDNADMRRFIRGALEPTYTVIEAGNGELGVRKAGETIPDLILCDVMMPVMDGCEATRLLKNDKATSHIPIILLTARAGEENVLEGLETMADDYIVKPFNTRLLRARIKNLITLRRRLQETIGSELTFPTSKIKISPIDREFLDDLREIIEKNISDSEFNVEELSRKLYLNRATVYRKIQALTGETPTEFIRSFRLKRAAELLKNNSGTILDVALEVGFSSANYFTKCFKQKFNHLPSDIHHTTDKRH